MDTIISQNINLILKEKNLTLKELSFRSSLSERCLDNILVNNALPSIEELKLISEALEYPLYWFFLPLPNFLLSWHLTIEELGEMVSNNPSLRGFMVGYMAEAKIRSYFQRHPEISEIYKPDDHDRSKKYDIILLYKGHQFTIEVKSLQTHTVRETNNGLIARFQCDASDRRVIELPNGHYVNTTNLKYGDFDIVAVNLFAFTGKWDYAFALNRDLPSAIQGQSKNKSGISEEDLKYLIMTTIKISYPLETPFVSDPFVLMNRLLQENR